jgi:sensor domain CHASE-containing protein
MFPQKRGAYLVRPLLDLVQKHLEFLVQAPVICDPKSERFEGFVRFHPLNRLNNAIEVLDGELSWKVSDFGVSLLSVIVPEEVD